MAMLLVKQSVQRRFEVRFGLVNDTKDYPQNNTEDKTQRACNENSKERALVCLRSKYDWTNEAKQKAYSANYNSVNKYKSEVHFSIDGHL